MRPQNIIIPLVVLCVSLITIKCFVKLIYCSSSKIKRADLNYQFHESKVRNKIRDKGKNTPVARAI